ncbi:MAG: type II toxin-antitoxin system RelE/ParE family toxin [Synergistota bacterium]|nr:type II toxin-antitoxin system RelE/ParE family toxin [Synergistota bacterium]
MAWTIEYDLAAVKDLKRIDKKEAKRIVDYMEERIAVQDNPGTLGKPLKGPLGAFWCYRVGDYRLICSIEDNKVTILVVRIGHRGDVYKK